jgi:uridine kinase
VKESLTKKWPRLIALAGGSGAGKSWLADQLQARLGKQAGRLSLDDFYRDLSHLAPERRARVNFDHPRSIDWALLDQTLDEALAGRLTRVPRYDFTQHTRSGFGEQWRPRPIILMDGLWLLRRRSVRRRCALTIFLECPEDLRLASRVSRDVQARGRTEDSVREQFARCVSPMHARYVAPQARWADQVFSGRLTVRDVDVLAELIQRLSTGECL